MKRCQRTGRIACDCYHCQWKEIKEALDRLYDPQLP
jgi:hypothetical protein